jgi:hypothetical protein
MYCKQDEKQLNNINISPSALQQVKIIIERCMNLAKSELAKICLIAAEHLWLNHAHYAKIGCITNKMKNT